MIQVDLPYDFGAFMKVKDENGNVDYCGTISAYLVASDGWLVWISRYRQACCGEYLPEEVEPMNEIEIAELKKQYSLAYEV